MLAFRITLFSMIIFLCAGTVHPFETRIEVTPQGDSNEISVIIMDPTPHPWDILVGYAVIRINHGECGDPVFLSEVMGFSDPITVTDMEIPSYYAYSYIAALIDTDGLARYSSGWGSIETLGGLEYPIVRGDIRSGGVFGGGLIYLCPNMCWGQFHLGTFIGVSGPVPDGYWEARDTGQVFDIYGTIEYNFEGPYMTLVSEIDPTTCDEEVPVRSTTWSTFKAWFR